MNQYYLKVSVYLGLKEKGGENGNRIRKLRYCKSSWSSDMAVSCYWYMELDMERICIVESWKEKISQYGL